MPLFPFPTLHSYSFEIEFYSLPQLLCKPPLLLWTARLVYPVSIMIDQCCHFSSINCAASSKPVLPSMCFEDDFSSHPWDGAALPFSLQSFALHFLRRSNSSASSSALSFTFRLYRPLPCQRLRSSRAN